MKRIISLVLVLISIMSICVIGTHAANLTPYYYEQREQYNNQNSFLGGGFYGSVSFFINNHSEKLYIKTSLNGASKAVRSGVCAGANSTIYKNYVYYIGEDGNLYRCSINGKVKQVIVKNIFITGFVVTNNKIMLRIGDPYMTPNENGLFQCELNGKNMKKLTSATVSAMYTWGTNIFFFNHSANRFQHYSFKTNRFYNDLKFNMNYCFPIGMDGKYFYFKKIVGSVDYIYRIDTAKKKLQGITKLYNDPYPTYAIAGGKLYKCIYGNYSAFYYRFNAKTQAFQYIKSYNKDLVGYMGFYKNYLVVNKYSGYSPTNYYYLIDKV